MIHAHGSVSGGTIKQVSLSLSLSLSLSVCGERQRSWRSMSVRVRLKGTVGTTHQRLHADVRGSGYHPVWEMQLALENVVKMHWWQAVGVGGL
jgi:hypothetical protein